MSRKSFPFIVLNLFQLLHFLLLQTNSHFLLIALVVQKFYNQRGEFIIANIENLLDGERMGRILRKSSESRSANHYNSSSLNNDPSKSNNVINANNISSSGSRREEYDKGMAQLMKNGETIVIRRFISRESTWGNLKYDRPTTRRDGWCSWWRMIHILSYGVFVFFMTYNLKRQDLPVSDTNKSSRRSSVTATNGEGDGF